MVFTLAPVALCVVAAFNADDGGGRRGAVKDFTAASEWYHGEAATRRSSQASLELDIAQAHDEYEYDYSYGYPYYYRSHPDASLLSNAAGDAGKTADLFGAYQKKLRYITFPASVQADGDLLISVLGYAQEEIAGTSRALAVAASTQSLQAGFKEYTGRFEQNATWIDEGEGAVRKDLTDQRGRDALKRSRT
jgi:hypothetical protein